MVLVLEVHAGLHKTEVFEERCKILQLQQGKGTGLFAYLSCVTLLLQTYM